MNSLTHKFWKNLSGWFVCSLMFIACSDAADQAILLKVDRSTTLDLQEVGKLSTLEGRWKSRGSMQIVKGAMGRYTARALDANPQCGVEPDDEVLRGRLDDSGILSGEILVCANTQCPGIAPRWIYFMALVAQDANSFVGAIAPTAHEGCNPMFRGMPLEAVREKEEPRKPDHVPSEILLPSDDGQVAKPASAQIGQNPQPRGTESKACKTSSKKGTLKVTLPASSNASVAIDGKVQGKLQGTKGTKSLTRELAAGEHTVTLIRPGLQPEVTRTICIQEGRTPIQVNFEDP